LQETFYQLPSEVPVPSVAAPVQNVQQPSGIPVRMPFDQNVTTDRKKRTGKNNRTALQNTAPRTGQYRPGLVQAIASGEISHATAVKYNLDARDVRILSGYSDYAKKKRADWSVGIYFNPEVTYCNDKSIDNTISYNVSILPSLNFNRFFIQSGVNMRFTHDQGNYQVDYNRFLGTYEDVYLVTFDSTDQGIIPTYYTQTVEVYDTINHYAISETKASYTYLEIPMLLGYRHTFGKFSLFAKAGPSASFLMTKNVPEADYPEDKARIINVDYQIPSRTTVNWQLVMGAGFDYKLAEQFSFSLEPTFRFALKPEFKLPDGARGNTASFGIRAGLNFNF
jgi:hypothetical protein